MGFLDDIIVKPLSNGRDWELQNEVKYATRAGEVIYIYGGFITDFASIPRPFRNLFSPDTGKHRRAAVVHDYLYRTATEKYTRAEADKIFLEIMEDDGVSWFTRMALYRAVRIGGSGSFVERTV